MEYVRKAGLTFQIEGLLHPQLPAEAEKWLHKNKIDFTYWENKWGPGGYHYDAFIKFENEEDAVLFKMMFV